MSTMLTVTNDRWRVSKTLELGFQKAAVGDRQLPLQSGHPFELRWQLYGGPDGIAAQGVIQMQPLLGYSDCIARCRTASSGANAPR